MVRLKFKSFSHVELADKVDEWIENFKKLQIVPIDSSFPKYVQENEEYLKSIGYIAELDI